MSLTRVANRPLCPWLVYLCRALRLGSSQMIFSLHDVSPFFSISLTHMISWARQSSSHALTITLAKLELSLRVLFLPLSCLSILFSISPSPLGTAKLNTLRLRELYAWGTIFTPSVSPFFSIYLSPSPGRDKALRRLFFCLNPFITRILVNGQTKATLEPSLRI